MLPQRDHPLELDGFDTNHLLKDTADNEVFGSNTEFKKYDHSPSTRSQRIICSASFPMTIRKAS